MNVNWKENDLRTADHFLSNSRSFIIHCLIVPVLLIVYMSS